MCAGGPRIIGVRSTLEAESCCLSLRRLLNFAASAMKRERSERSSADARLALVVAGAPPSAERPGSAGSDLSYCGALNVPQVPTAFSFAVDGPEPGACAASLPHTETGTEGGGVPRCESGVAGSAPYESGVCVACGRCERGEACGRCESAADGAICRCESAIAADMLLQVGGELADG